MAAGKTKPVRRDGFKFDGDKFTTVTGYELATRDTLLRLCEEYENSPTAQRGPGRPRKGKSEDDDAAKPTLTKQYALAQFRLHGVPYFERRDADWFKVFQHCVARKLFHGLSPVALRAKDEMAREWHQKDREHMAALVKAGPNGATNGVVTNGAMERTPADDASSTSASDIVMGNGDV